MSGTVKCMYSSVSSNIIFCPLLFLQKTFSTPSVSIAKNLIIGGISPKLSIIKDFVLTNAWAPVPPNPINTVFESVVFAMIIIICC